MKTETKNLYKNAFILPESQEKGLICLDMFRNIACLLSQTEVYEQTNRVRIKQSSMVISSLQLLVAGLDPLNRWCQILLKMFH